MKPYLGGTKMAGGGGAGGEGREGGVSVNYFPSLLLTGTLFLSDDIPLYLLLII